MKDVFDTIAELKIISMDEIKAKEVDWLWYPYIPYGKITIVQGDPGEGKTTFVLQLAALLSKGEKLPCVDDNNEPISIIYQTAEDGLDDTIKPRLVEAYADCSKIKVIDESKDPLTMTDERIETAIAETGARLIILDPIQAYLGANVDMHRANEIRPVLQRLAFIAEKYKCAIVLIGHMNKSKGAKSTYRGLGSIDFQATARSVLIVGRIKENPTVRVIAHEKSSLAPEGDSIAFELDTESGFSWMGHYDISAEDLLSGSPKENKTKMAQQLIFEMLENGAVQQKVIWEKANSMGISKRVLDQAKKNLEVKSKRIDSSWYWIM
jgi:KaiC/GvpD/RAD55 family RecA-like ATPase